MEDRFSRHTVLAAIDVLEWGAYQSTLTSLYLELGAEVNEFVRSESYSKTHRMNDLKRFVDEYPDFTVAGEPIQTVLVEKAVCKLVDRGCLEEDTDQPGRGWLQAFLARLQQDGFSISDGSLRRLLPADLKLPEAVSELTYLIEKHVLATAKGHLDQMLNAHARGDWSAANGQMRNLLDAIFDEIAARLDETAANIESGHSRRAKLAKLGFLSRKLNEWHDDGKGFINGLFKRLHPEGPHKGLSDEDDSTFRLHVVLLTARLFLRRFDGWSS